MSQTEAPSVIDFEALLAPIPGEHPTGVDLRESEDAKYYEVRDLRKAEIENERANQRFALMNADDLALEESLRSNPRRAANWGLVVSKASFLLANSSKDLWIVAWLIEALVREKGIAGLRDGIRLSRQLSEQYWDSILPRPNEDEGGDEWTLSQLNGLNETLSKTLERVPLFRSDVLEKKIRVFTLLTYSEAEKLEKMPSDVRSARVGEGAATLEDFQNAGRKATIQELLEHSATIASTIREISQYYDTLTRLASGSLEVSKIEKSLAEYSNCFHQLTKGRSTSLQQTEETQTGLTTGTEESVPGTHRSVSMLNKQIMTRDDALEGLLKVADFFRRTEPHSPVSYALEQAVRWGRMPLPELLGDLISDQNVREEMFRRLGIQNPTDSQNSGDDS